MEAIDIIIDQLRKQKRKCAWIVTSNIADVPEGTGHYALYDGIEVRSAGVSYNMRKSLKESRWFSVAEMPIFMWFPDADGSAAEWLNLKK
jgi:hypothetical protein